MSSYSIKDLERISNLKAHTIRIWEQRYGLLVPDRTDTNIRSYNDEQLKKLLNVCTLMNKGMKISKISKLSKEEIAAEIDKIISESFQGDIHAEALINQALIAITTYDGRLFDQLFLDAVNRMGLERTYTKVIYPLLVRTGLMWIKDYLIPSQEHFLSNLIRQKLFAAMDALPIPEDPDQIWVLFLNEEEDHEIGLLFAAYVLRQFGKSVIYLGSRVPYADLARVAVQCNATHIYSFIVKNQYEEALEKFVVNLGNDFREAVVCISGGNERIQKIALENNIVLIADIESLTELLNDHHA